VTKDEAQRRRWAFYEAVKVDKTLVPYHPDLRIARFHPSSISISSGAKQTLTLQRQKMVILVSYLGGEAYGLLGPQIAATIIQDHSPYDCVVIAVTKEDNKGFLKKCLADYFGPERPMIAFSYLSGREDLYRFAKELKEEGAMTILAGPQAEVDYLGEREWQEHSHRFHGLSSFFSLAVHGPAERILPFLRTCGKGHPDRLPGMLWMDQGGALHRKPGSPPWDPSFLRNVSWDNLFRLGKNGISPKKIETGQVLWQIGCPHAALEVQGQIAYPSFMGGPEKGTIRIPLRGCSFCDVAVDKGFCGALDMETVIRQIQMLPEGEDGRKVAFELINENALPGLSRLLLAVTNRKIRLSQINLTLRADWLACHEAGLRQALNTAKGIGIRIFLGSVGFESFDDTILANLNKGLDVAVNLEAVKIMRRMKEEFPDHWGYSRKEGAVHGFIHPTPWDTRETEAANQKNIGLYGLNFDILPEHSTPLIIHHASPLGDWIREIELREAVQFKREGTIIGWWQVGDRFVL
jgi:hypothetical protein